MKKTTTLTLLATALALCAAAEYLELELRPGTPAEVNHAAALHQVQVSGGATNETGLSVSVVRGGATNELVSAIAAAAGTLAAAPCTNGFVALPGDALLLLPADAAPARATAVLRR